MADNTDNNSPKINMTNEQIQLEIKSLEQKLKSIKDINKFEEISLEILQKQQKLLLEQITLLDKGTEKQQEQARGLKEVYLQQQKWFEDRHQNLEKEIELEKEVLELSRDFAKEINTSIGMVSELNQTGFGKMLNLIQKSGGSMAALNKISAELSKDLGKRFAASIYEKLEELTIASTAAFVKFASELDHVGANLAKITPQGRDFLKQIEQIVSSGNEVGLTYEDVGESIASLTTNYADFTTLNKETQNKLITLSATLEKIGVSTEDFSRNTNFLTKSMGYSTDEVADFENGLNKLSGVTKKGLGALNKEFEQMSKKLAGLGKAGALKAFTDLQKASKALGIETSRLLDISQGFDTFESAADAAGTLNSVLGGNLINSIDLMNASLDSPIEVFKLFKTSLDKTGKSVNQMTNAQQKLIAETMHMDVSELRSLSEIDLNKAIKQMEDTAAAAKDMKQMAKDAQPALDKLTKIFYKFALFVQPVVEKLNDFADWLLKVTQDSPGAVYAISLITAAIGGFVILAPKLMSSIALFKAITGKFGGGGAVEAIVGKGETQVLLNKFSSKLTEVGTSASAGAKGFLAFGAAALMVGAGIAIAALGVSKFVEAFQGMQPEQIYAVATAITVFLGAMVGIVAIMAAAAGPIGAAGIELLPFGAAIALIGAGVGLAAWGMSKLVSAFSEFMAVADLGKLATLYIGIQGLSLAFASLAASFLLLGAASPNLLVFGLAVRVSLNDAVLDRLQKVAEYMSMISESLENMKVEKLTALAAAASVAASMNIGDMNEKMTAGAAANNTAASSGPITVQIPDQTFKIEINSPIMLDGVKVGDFVQEQIVKRENKLVPGSIQSAIGIKVGSYNE